MVNYCDICGKKLVTDRERSSGICDDCYDEDEMNNLASNIIYSNDMPPSIDDF